MEKSLFIEYVKKWFGPIVKKISETVNGSKEDPTYLHDAYLTKEYSPDLTYASSSVSSTVVAAEFVALDSSLPLKKRDTMGKASGDIPKSGMKRKMNEKTLQLIGNLRRKGGMEAEIVKRLFGDIKKGVLGVKEAMEYAFLQAASTGYSEIADDARPGVAVRLNHGHPDANKYGVTTPWSDAASKPIDDIKRIIRNARAKGVTPMLIWMDSLAFDNFAGNQQTREQFAFNQNFVGSNIPTPSQEQIGNMLRSQFKLELRVIDRAVTFERDGKRTVKYPWAEGVVSFFASSSIGRLVHGPLVEEDHPVAGVEYQKAEGYILASKYRTNDPVNEISAVQANAIPVLDNVDDIFILNSEEAATDTQTESDADFDYDGDEYTKVSVIAALNLAKPTNKLTVSSTDAKILAAINQLSDEQIEIFEANIVASA